MRIVNVDDDDDDREMFCTAVRNIDPAIQCIELESGEEAIKYFGNGHFSPEFIFVDINMPRMNGYECVKEIHQYPNLKNTTIVMYSSSFNPQDQIDFGVLGIKYLLKTSDLTSLAKSIRILIETKFLEDKLKM